MKIRECKHRTVFYSDTFKLERIRHTTIIEWPGDELPDNSLIGELCPCEAITPEDALAAFEELKSRYDKGEATFEDVEEFFNLYIQT